MRNDRETRLEEARERSLIYSSSEILVLTIRFRSSEYLSFEIMPILLCLHMLLGSVAGFLYLFLLFLKYFQARFTRSKGNGPSLIVTILYREPRPGISTGCHRIIAIIAMASL